MKNYRVRVIVLLFMLIVLMCGIAWCMSHKEEVYTADSACIKKCIAALEAAGEVTVEPRDTIVSAAPESERTEEKKIIPPENPFGEPELIRATCYVWTGNRCADGSWPKVGVSVAGKREWLGKTAILHAVDEETGDIGEFIGYFEFTDTGAGIDTDGDGEGDSIRNGTSIDIYRETLDGCYEWIREYGDYVYMQIVDAKG